MKKILSILVILSLLLSAFPRSAFAAAGADLDQGSNGSITSPISPVNWVNGNLNSTKAHYEEGDSVPYRAVLTSLSAGTHVLTIQWDTRSGGKNALDYITQYENIGGFGGIGNTPEVVDPTTGIAGLGSPSTYQIPVPATAGSSNPGQPATSFSSLPADKKVLTIWNGSITNAVYSTQDSLSGASASSSLDITFTSSAATVVVAWGGHIASPEDWGLANSASNISGSPYHMRILSFDGSGGNQDRSLSAEAVIPVASADLGITKSVSNAAPHVGDQIIYTLTVVNSGPNASTGAVVNDVLPAGLAYVSSSASVGTYSAISGVWTIGSLAVSATATLTITANVTAAAVPGIPITNTAAVIGNEVDPMLSDNTSSVTVTPLASTDLAIAKTAPAGPYQVGAQVSYTITVVNNGPDAATAVAVSDALPAQLSLVSSSASVGSYSGSAWTIGSLASGASATLTITASVNAIGSILNVASVTGAEFDPDTSNNTAQAAISGSAADLAVTKTADPATAFVGDSVDFVVTVTNQGPGTASGVSVSDALPAGLVLISSTASQGSYVGGVWSVGSLANGQQATLELVVEVATTGLFTNTATATSSTSDPNPGNNTASATVTGVASADIAVVKTVDDPSATVGSSVVFTVVVTNNGPSAATNVAVADTLPAGLTFVSSTVSTGAYAAGVWTVGSLASGASATLTITATVDVAGPLTNTATGTATQHDPNLGNNTGNAAVNGTATVDVAVQKTVDNAAPHTGDTITYTISAFNAGPSTATSVVVTDLIPAGLALQSSAATLGTWSGSTWTIGTLTAGQSAVLTLVVLVTPATTPGTPVPNTATITATEPDTHTADNTSTVTIIPQAAADLAITKSLLPAAGPYLLGQQITYTVTVTNNGPDAASSVTVSDVLPAALTAIVVAPGVGSWASPTWTTGSLATGASASMTVTGTIRATGTVTNAASVTGGEFDPDTSNNTAEVTFTAAGADLSITKTAVSATPHVNSQTSFTITIVNHGPDAASAVTVTDALPSELVYVSSTPSKGTFNGSVWSLGTLANGEQATLEILTNVVAAGEVTNTAVAASTTPDPNLANNTASVTVSAHPQADLAVTITTPTPVVVQGSFITFNMTASNLGLSTGTGIVTTFQLPAGIIFSSATPSQGTYNAATGVWTIGTLTVGQTVALSVTGTVIASGSIAIPTHVTGTEHDHNQTNNDAFVVIQAILPQADLVVTKAVNNPSPLVGSQVVFTVSVRNAGPQGATGVAVNDILPAGLGYVSSSATQGFYAPAAGIWTIGALANGQTATLRVTALVSTTGTKVNIATVTATQPDGNPANNTASVVVSPGVLPPPVPVPADLSITKTVDNASPTVGSNVVFTIMVRNGGPGTATGVTVQDLLPAGLPYVSSQATQGSYSSGSGQWSVGTILSGSGAYLTITVTMNTANRVTNTATVTGNESDPTLANNSSSVTLDPVSPPVVLGPKLDPLNLAAQICRESELVVDASWTLGTAPFSWTVNFGDRSAAVTGTSTDRRLVARHLYAAEGTYTITVTVMDAAGKTDTLSHTLKAVNCDVTEVYHQTFFIGYPDGMFKPERNVSRAEVAASIARALGLGWSSVSPSYPDVAPTHWAAGYVQLMRDEGIMLGDTSGTFRPDAFITRAEASAVLLRMLKVAPFYNLPFSSFKDVPPTHWAIGYIESMQKYGLITGYPDGTYRPDALILRSEYTAIADRALGREIADASQVQGLEGGVRWPDVPSTHWAYLYILEASTPHTAEDPVRLNRVIVLKDKTVPLFSDGTGTVVIRKVGDVLTAIVPVDGLAADGSDPQARSVTVRITTTLKP